MYVDRRWWSVTCLMLALLFLPSLAAAQGGACHTDVQRLCSAAKGQPGGVSSCLREHLSELSEPCRQQIEQRGAQTKGAGAQVRTSCADELGRFCPDVTKGSGGMLRCLRQHEAELGEACRTALPPRGRGGAPPAP